MRKFISTVVTLVAVAAVLLAIISTGASHSVLAQLVPSLEIPAVPLDHRVIPVGSGVIKRVL